MPSARCGRSSCPIVAPSHRRTCRNCRNPFCTVSAPPIAIIPATVGAPHIALLARDRWNYNGNAALVIGATYPEELRHVRELCPDMPFLVPGVGAQGGDVEKVVKFGCDRTGHGIVINSSRGIIYADKTENFAAGAGNAARELRDLVNSFRD